MISRKMTMKMMSFTAMILRRMTKKMNLHKWEAQAKVKNKYKLQPRRFNS